MIKTAGRATPFLNYLCVILLFAIFALQLMPGYWNGTKKVETIPTEPGAEPTVTIEEVSVSIQYLVWFPANETDTDTPATDMVKYFEDKYSVKGDKWRIGDIVLMPVMIVACCIVTFFFGIKKPTRLWMNIVYMLAGVLGLVTYLTEPIYQLNSMYMVHAGVCGALILASIANIAFRPWKRIMRFVKTGD